MVRDSEKGAGYDLIPYPAPFLLLRFTLRNLLIVLNVMGDAAYATP